MPTTYQNLGHLRHSHRNANLAATAVEQGNLHSYRGYSTSPIYSGELSLSAGMNSGRRYPLPDAVYQDSGEHHQEARTVSRLSAPFRAEEHYPPTALSRMSASSWVHQQPQQPSHPLLPEMTSNPLPRSVDEILVSERQEQSHFIPTPHYGPNSVSIAGAESNYTPNPSGPQLGRRPKVGDQLLIVLKAPDSPPPRRTSSMSAMNQSFSLAPTASRSRRLRLKNSITRQFTCFVVSLQSHRQASASLTLALGTDHIHHHVPPHCAYTTPHVSPIKKTHHALYHSSLKQSIHTEPCLEILQTQPNPSEAPRKETNPQVQNKMTYTAYTPAPHNTTYGVSAPGHWIRRAHAKMGVPGTFGERYWPGKPMYMHQASTTTTSQVAVRNTQARFTYEPHELEASVVEPQTGGGGGGAFSIPQLGADALTPDTAHSSAPPAVVDAVPASPATLRAQTTQAEAAVQSFRRDEGFRSLAEYRVSRRRRRVSRFRLRSNLRRNVRRLATAHLDYYMGIEGVNQANWSRRLRAAAFVERVTTWT
ncbi:hypothetical protein BDV95DRAFT_672241 [Massariosphaeria phaeospora]|uniref:Uncharacterized protein n=1 Tax=Massariosphaeria phaeospora TaxID=100035 RepID=A0A7C8M258_9PLEO|nr:hypothetical protein BDV95DRAFT_672241 [Massariosphaeria phaeospora]